MEVKINSEEKFTFPVYHVFTGSYKIPKDETFDLYSVTVGHLFKDNGFDQMCDFTIEKENGSWLIVPDVSKIDLQGSMKFFLSMKKIYLLGEVIV